MLHAPSYERIVATGVLADKAGIEAARQRRKEMVAELAALGRPSDDAGRDARDRLEREIRGLATIIGGHLREAVRHSRKGVFHVNRSKGRGTRRS